MAVSSAGLGRTYQARVAPLRKPIVLDGHTIELDEYSLRYEAKHPRSVPVYWRHRVPVGRPGPPTGR